MTKIIDTEVMQVEYETTEEWDDIPRHHPDLFYVVATLPDGEMYRHEHLFSQEGDAENLARKIMEHGKINLDHWHFWRTVYGSVAFEKEEAEAALYAHGLRAGHIGMDDVPDNIRTLL